MTTLANSEVDQICEVLSRRANELATFGEDLKLSFAGLTSKPSLNYTMPGSVELAIHREVRRLRDLEEKLRFLKSKDEE